MEKIILKAKLREEKGRKLKPGRKSGLVPAVIYGKNVATQNLWVNMIDLQKILKKSGESIIIELVIGEKDRRNVIIHEIQRDPIKGKFIHIDFYQVNMAEKIEAEVELIFIGESPVIKEQGGVLVKNLDKVKIKCLPVDLPSHINVDISLIQKFEQYILAKDLNVSDKVELDIDPETVIALVVPPRTDEELKSLEEKVEADVTQVEGIVKEETVVSDKESTDSEKIEK